VALTAHKRTEAQWDELINRGYWLEDEVKNSTSNERRFKRQHEVPASSGVLAGVSRFFVNPSTEWYSRCLVKPLLYKLCAVVCLLMSAMLTWSEITFFSESPTLSLFALFIQAGANDLNYGAIEFVSFFTICYMCTCAYYTLFKVRVLNYYYLAPNHQSDSYTLLFSGALLCRLTPPLCLNFLSLIHMDSHVIPSYPMLETAYTRVMGHMDVVSIVQDYFNIYFPILLLILTTATYFSLGSRLLSSLGFQQFLEQEEQTGELVEEGRELVKREKRRRERLAEQGRSRREWTDNWSDNLPSATEARQRQITARDDDSSAAIRPAAGSTANYAGCVEDLQKEPSTIRPSRHPPRNLFDDI